MLGRPSTIRHLDAELLALWAANESTALIALRLKVKRPTVVTRLVTLGVYEPSPTGRNTRSTRLAPRQLPLKEQAELGVFRAALLYARAQRAYRAYRAGLSLLQVAMRLKITASQVRRDLARIGVKSRPKYEARRLADARRRRAAEAKERDRLHRAKKWFPRGATTDPGEQRRAYALADAAILRARALYREGWDLQAIRDECGCAPFD